MTMFHNIVITVLFVFLFYALFIEIKGIKRRRQEIMDKFDADMANMLRMFGHFAEAREKSENTPKETPTVESKTFIKKRKQENENSEV